MKKTITSLLVLFLSLYSSAQDDTLFNKTLNELIVTATRTERKLSNVAVPVQMISKKTIWQSGSLRLHNILAEQTGLYTTSAGATTSAGGGVFGNGIQIQGLSPDYTLILLDGEPIIGRQGGVLDVSRLAVGNIKKIEIVKGPSSSLYGSEAMGGVINIITEQGHTNKSDASFRYGRFHAADVSLNAALKKQKWAMNAFVNSNSANGFDQDKSTPAKTVDPYRSYTSHVRLGFSSGEKSKISLSARYYHEKQDNYFLTQDINNGSSLIAISGDGQVRDFNLNPVFTRQFNNKLRSSMRVYFSRYEYEQSLLRETDKSLYYYDFFRQDFYRAENQTDLRLPADNFFTAGAGIVSEKLNTTRYEGKRSNDIRYLFIQDEWRAHEKLILIGGMRYDDNSSYKSRLSPKLALRYKFNEKIHLTTSYGSGFKAPDFRQLFLNFLNTAAGGYVVYGANEITIAKLEQQKQQGIISEMLPRAYHLAALNPEISKGWNAGVHYYFNDNLQVNLNLFRNDISNLIQVEVIAFRSNNAPVYSYFNVKEAYTQGAELNSSWQIKKDWNLQVGYQFLVTADKDDIRQIKEGTVFTRDPVTNETYRIQRSDYKGLPNRSAHMLNARLFYDNEKKGWSGSFRMLYRSGWGTYDKDGNGLINRRDELARGFAQINISVAKTIQSFRIQAGIDNVLNYTDIINLPAQPGIQPYISVFYSFLKNKHIINH
jgi:outer membrane receptor for ferrienterochelin and colicins